jgi:hypothetical protein
MTLSPNDHKRGDTFAKMLGLPASIDAGYFVGWDVAGQIRTPQGRLIADVVVTWLDEPDRKTLQLYVEDTKTWRLGTHELDVQFTRISDGFVVSTATIPINVIRDVTLVPEPAP